MFTLKLNDYTLPNGKLIRGEEQHFENGAAMARWYDEQMKVRHPKKHKPKKPKKQKEG